MLSIYYLYSNCKCCISAQEPQKPFLWNKPASIIAFLWYDLRVRCVLMLVVKHATEEEESSPAFEEEFIEGA